MVHLQKGEKDFYLGYQFVTSFGSLLRLLYPRFEYAAVLTITSLVAAGSYEVLSYHSGKIIGSFYSALLGRNETLFWELVFKATLIYLGQSLLQATVSFLTWLLNISMRRNLVSALHRLYFSRDAYFRLNSVDNAGIDNPDQRITQDAERMCSKLAKDIFPYILIAPGVIAFYTYKTWMTAGPFGVAIIYTYFVLGVIANRILVSPLTKWTARVERSEGDFRYKHVSVRNYAEESAFYNAAEFDRHETDRFLNTLLKRQLTATLWKYPAQFLQKFFDYYGAILSYLIQVFPIFILNSYKDMDPATLGKVISNNTFFFIYLINSFTRLTDLAMHIGEMAGYSQRIAELVSYMECMKSEDGSSWSSGDAASKDSVNLLIAENLAYSSPTDPDRELVSGLNICLPKDKSLLITGHSGVGKSSLLRIVKKLWEPRSGSIVRNFTPDTAMFLPQRPYFPPGQLSIRQQVVFPRVESEVPCIELEDSRVMSILSSLGLKALISMCGGITDAPNFEWQETLSPGEQQRLSIARVLYHRPRFVFLDEATSSLSLDAEAVVYSSLKQNGTSYISTGHRRSLLDYHDWELRLNGRDGWELITEKHQELS